MAGASPETVRLLELMDEFAGRHGLVVKQSRTGQNYNPPEPQPGAKYDSDVDVYATSRGVEFNLQVFRDVGADTMADDLLHRIRTITGVAVSASGWPVVPCDVLLRSWARAQTEVIEPYYAARAQMRAATVRRDGTPWR